MKADKTRTMIVSGAIGNVLEWHDFGIYGYFAASIGRTFTSDDGQLPVSTDFLVR
jgi:hypothetical protein